MDKNILTQFDYLDDAIIKFCNRRVDLVFEYPFFEFLRGQLAEIKNTLETTDAQLRKINELENRLNRRKNQRSEIKKLHKALELQKSISRENSERARKYLEKYIKVDNRNRYLQNLFDKQKDFFEEIDKFKELKPLDDYEYSNRIKRLAKNPTNEDN